MIKELDVLKLPFYQWQLEDEIIDKVNSIVPSLDYFPNDYNFSTNYSCDLDFIVDEINYRLDELKEILYPNNNQFKIEVTEYWANKTDFSSQHHKHNHPNSLFSGIIYLTNHNKGGFTRFYYENLFYWHPFIVTLNQNKDLHFDVSPKKGMMIVFPSNIKHSVVPNRSRETRYTISFNTFFKGMIGENSYNLKI